MPPNPADSARFEPPRLVHLDASLAVIYKPAGMLVHRTDLDRHERRAALQWTRDQLGRRVYPVHRLDKPTAGLLVFALDPAGAAALEARFAAGDVDKRYLAVVRGHTPECDRIDHPLRPDPERGGRGPVQPALTEYQCLARSELPVAVRPYASSRYSLLEVRPRTGRQHQIRRHLKHVFHPLVGDTTYGDGHHNRSVRRHFGCFRLMLVAIGIAFEHPANGSRLALRVAPDADYSAVLERLDLAGPRTPGGAGFSAGCGADTR